MKIVQLHAENFKRLGVVEISPEGSMVTIGGKNGHGKSSVLDAIFVALKGRAVAPPQPIRKGQDKCTIRLDMGDVVVTRNFHTKEGGTYTDTLKVENADGLRYQSPQEVLGALLGEVGFDPFAFVNLKPKDQAARLLEMVPLSIDLDEFRQADASDYSNRTDTNRDVARLSAQVSGIPVEEVPEVAPDRSALTDALGSAADTNSGIERERARRGNEHGAILSVRAEAQAAKDEAVKLRSMADHQDEVMRAKNAEATERRDALDALPPLADPVDTDAIREQLRDAEDVLAAIDRQSRRKALAGELAEAEVLSQSYTDAMAARAKERNAALAEAEMPVPGLAFALDDKGAPVLTYEGLPFDKDQISTAVQLRVSTAIGMAANPRLRVLRISDGSLLDEDSMAMLAEMAEAEDFQLWIEVVGDGGVGIIMENGLVRGDEKHDDANAPAAEAAPANLSQDGPTLTEQRKAKGRGKDKAAETGGLL